MNSIAIHGRLVRDPDIRTTQSGVSVCNFTVAVDRSYTKQGEEKQADFFTVVCWRGLAEMVAKHFTRGKEIIVTGEMHSHKWVDDGGNNRVSWEIQAGSVDFCGKKEEGTVPTPMNAGEFEELEGEDNEELPF